MDRCLFEVLPHGLFVALIIQEEILFFLAHISHNLFQLFLSHLVFSSLAKVLVLLVYPLIEYLVEAVLVRLPNFPVPLSRNHGGQLILEQPLCGLSGGQIQIREPIDGHLLAIHAYPLKLIDVVVDIAHLPMVINSTCP